MEVSLQVSDKVTEVLLSPAEYGLDGDPERKLLPYKSDRPLKYMAKYGLQMPGKLITKADGISTCQGCGQTYAGKHAQCKKPGTVVNVTDKYGWTNTKRSKEYRASEGDRVHWVREELCGGYCTWNLESSFDSQARFFDLMEEMPEHDAVVPVSTYTGQGSIQAAAVPLILAQQFMILHLKYENSMLMDGMRKQQQMLNEIANKMHMAGQHLCF